LLSILVDDVERLANLAAAAHIMLSREIAAGTDIGGVSLLVILRDMQELSAKLNSQRNIVMPSAGGGSLDSFHDRAFKAERYIQQLEVLLSVIDEKALEADEPINTLSSMCRGECLPALKRAFYENGEQS
jgi:hypothetical protein